MTYILSFVEIRYNGVYQYREARCTALPYDWNGDDLHSFVNAIPDTCIATNELFHGPVEEVILGVYLWIPPVCGTDRSLVVCYMAHRGVPSEYIDPDDYGTILSLEDPL